MYSVEKGIVCSLQILCESLMSVQLSHFFNSTNLLFIYCCMSSLTFNNISLSEFCIGASGGEDKDGIPEMLRYMQKGAFEIFWKCHRGKEKTLITYQNMGQASQAIVPEDARLKTVIKRIAQTPITGVIRNPIHFHQDFRFIAFIHGHELYMVLENAAADARLSQIWRYDEDFEGFVPGKGVSLIDFFINNKIEIPTEKTV